MKKFQIFQYISLIRYKALNSISENFRKKNISLILDFEDSAQDLFSKKNTLKLKKLCRQGLIYLANNGFLNKNKIYLRINSPKSFFYKSDIKVINKVINKFDLKGIFFPKIENYSQIIKLNNDLKIKKNIIPIIETKNGLRNLDKILLQDKKKIIKQVHYGHFDYCLNNLLWPFPEPYHQEYWDIIKKIIITLKKYNREYIHTPYPLIHNSDLYWSSLNYISNEFGLKKINTTLVSYDEKFYTFPKNIKKLRIKKQTDNYNYKLSFSRKIIKEYIENKSPKKSFSLSKKRFIAPHQYLMAKKYFDKHNK